MNMKKMFLLFSAVSLVVLLVSAGAAMANGTLTVTFVYNGSGSSQALTNAYLYLQSGPAPHGVYRKARYILGPTDTNGSLSVSVPDGSYDVLLMRRAPLSSTPASSQMYGPPRQGDYTAISYINVTDGSNVNLGTVYATVFGTSLFGTPITITGTVTHGGNPVKGYFVFATTSQCSFGWQNGCGGQETCFSGSGCCLGANGIIPGCYAGSGGCRSSVYPSGCQGEKYPAIAPTDSNGNYTINLSSPGTYYVFAEHQPGSPPSAHAHSVENNPSTSYYYDGSASGWVPAWDPAPSCAAAICGGQSYSSYSQYTGTALCYSDCPVTVNGNTTVNIAW